MAGYNLLVPVFQSLAKRMYKENRLSDLTFALAENIPEFRDQFLRFFWEDLEPSPSPWEIRREHPLDNYAVDFSFKSGDATYYIENKIFDKNYHVEDYSSKITINDQNRIALISAHTLSSEDSEKAKDHDWEIKYWYDFPEWLGKRDFGEWQPVVNGYIAFIKEVCVIKETGPIELEVNSLRSVDRFFNLATRIVSSASNENVSVEICAASAHETSSQWWGKYYHLKPKKAERGVYPWFGLSCYSEPGILVSIEKYDNKPFIGLYPKLAGQQTELFTTHYEEEELYFKMGKEPFSKFLEASAKPEEQEAILRKFFDAANTCILSGLFPGYFKQDQDANA